MAQETTESATQSPGAALLPLFIEGEPTGSLPVTAGRFVAVLYEREGVDSNELRFFTVRIYDDGKAVGMVCARGGNWLKIAGAETPLSPDNSCVVDEYDFGPRYTKRRNPQGLIVIARRFRRDDKDSPADSVALTDHELDYIAQRIQDFRC